MTTQFIYVDESGDLGWTFNFKYRAGGSSRYLTIAAVMVPNHKRNLIFRLIKKLYTKFHWNTKTEKKWSEMTINEKKYFAELAFSLVEKNSDVQYFSITVYKPNVQQHIRTDSNKLYNYMISLMINHHMAKYKEIVFNYDQRTLKVKSGNSLYDYLITELWFKHNAQTTVRNYPTDSASNKGVQFADMLSGMVQHHFEDSKSEPYQILSKYIASKTLFFP